MDTGCAGMTVGRGERSFRMRLVLCEAQAAPAMRCQLTFNVENRNRTASTLVRVISRDRIKHGPPISKPVTQSRVTIHRDSKIGRAHV